MNQQPVTEVNVQPPTREQIRRQVRDAVEAAEEGARAAGDAGDAQRVVRIQGGRPPSPPGPFVFTSQPGFNPDSGMPREIVDISIGFFIACAVMVIGWPLARAFGRRIERGGVPAPLDPKVVEQLQRIEQAVDSMSVEIERISESQRFIAKLQHQASAELRAGAERPAAAGGQ